MAAAAQTVLHTMVHTKVSEAGHATTILAAVGVVLAMASLAWQAWSFRIAGSRISATVARGLKRGNAVVMTSSTDSTGSDVDALTKQGFVSPVVAVRVYNAGRGSTSIVGILLSVGRGSGITDAKLDPPLPFRLEGESEKTWYFDATLLQGLAEVWSQADPSGSWNAVYAEVRLGGSRKTIVSENTVPVGPLSGSG